MKKLLYVLTSLLTLVASSFGAASFTTVTATLTDSSLQIWSNAQVIATLKPSPFNPGAPLNNGLAITDSPQTIVTDGTGTFTLNLDDTNHITPAGAQWTFCIYPNASVNNGNCTTLPITGGSMNLTGLLSNILTTPAVVGLPVVNRAYNQNEVTSGNGGLYWDVTANVLKGCTLVAGVCTWTTIGNIGVPGNINYIPFNNGAGGFTASPSLQFNPLTGIFTTIDEVVTSIQTNTNLLSVLATTPLSPQPTCAFTSGGGTNPSCNAFGSNSLGQVRLQPGLSPSSSGSFTLTFASPGMPLISNVVNCLILPWVNGPVVWNARVGFQEQSSSTVAVVINWDNNGVNLFNGSVYILNYLCWAQ